MEQASQWYCDYRELHVHIPVSKYSLDTSTWKKMEEAWNQEMKKAWYFHDSSWYMRGANGYDGHGGNGTVCVLECEYFKPCLYPELESSSLLQECDNNNRKLLLVSRRSTRNNDSICSSGDS
jgi:hypothetical protein